MSDRDAPEWLRPTLATGTNLMDELRTQRIRYRRSEPPPEVTPTEPADALRDTALHRDAPIELVRLARAVRSGRTSWDDIVEGRANGLPEVVALFERGKRLDVAAREIPADVEPPAPVAPVRRVVEQEPPDSWMVRPAPAPNRW